MLAISILRRPMRSERRPMTGAVHARFVHRQPLSALGIGVLLGLPIVYVAMLLLHATLRGVSQ